MQIKGRRQIAKRTKRQSGFDLAMQILNLLSISANQIRDILEKGRTVDTRTGQPIPLPCAPADIIRAWSPEQHAGVLDNISTWATEPEPPPKPSAAPKRSRASKAKK